MVGAPVCVFARQGPMPPQTKSCIVVSADGETWVLLNACPFAITRNERINLCRTPKLCNTQPLAAVVLINSGIDPIAGLPVLRQPTGSVVCATGGVLSIPADNDVFGLPNPDLETQKRMQISTFSEPAPGLKITPCNVPEIATNGKTLQ